MSVLLVGVIIYFSAELLLSAMLIYCDVKDYFKKDDGLVNNIYRCETATSALLGAGLAALCIASIVAIVIALLSRSEVSWIDVIIAFNLHLLVGTNLARILRHLMFRRWAVWLANTMALLTALDISHVATAKRISYAYESALLARLAIASLLSSALARNQAETHLVSGRHEIKFEYMLLLNMIIITNAAAALAQLCGATILSSLSLAYTSMDGAQLCRGILLVCTVTQLLCYVPFFWARIKRRLPYIRSICTRDHNEEGRTRLGSL